MYMVVCVREDTYVRSGMCEVRKNMELESQVAVSLPTWVLEIKLW